MTVREQLSEVKWLDDLAKGLDKWCYSFENIDYDVKNIVKSIIKESKKPSAFQVEVTDCFVLLDNSKLHHSADLIKFARDQNLKVSMTSGIVNSMVNYCGFFIKGLTPETINLLKIVYPSQILLIIKGNQLFKDLKITEKKFKKWKGVENE